MNVTLHIRELEPPAGLALVWLEPKGDEPAEVRQIRFVGWLGLFGAMDELLVFAAPHSRRTLPSS